ncbi:MAG: glycosyltransferase family 2 protein [Thermomicrobiales bacterium]
MTTPDLTVCVPVYNAAHLVRDTLGSIARQSLTGIQVLVSVDESSDASLAVCREWADDPRFTLVAQPTRLGWPGNINWLLEQVETPLFCIIPHDDWIEPNYLERLRDCLRRHSTAALAYGDIELHDAASPMLHEPSITGTPFERVQRFLLDRTAAIEFRGVIRTAAARRVRPLQSANGGFAADTLWLLELVACGDFQHTPDVVFHKRIHDAAASGGWLRRSPEQAASEWTEHALACLETALASADWSAEEQIAIAAAGIARAIRYVHVPDPFPAEPPDAAAILERAGHLVLRLSASIPAGTPAPVAAPASRPLASWASEHLGYLQLTPLRSPLVSHLQPPVATPEVPPHHAPFAQFACYSGEREPGLSYDWVGSKTHPSCMPDQILSTEVGSYPSLEEEYFEWTDLLASALDAGERYVMHEWGAGFGRWGVRAALLARMAGAEHSHIVFVEAEPTHAGWLAEHAARNLGDPARFSYDVHAAALATSPSQLLFYTAMPPGSESSSPREWYGQGIVPATDPPHHIIRRADGQQDIVLSSGYIASVVPGIDTLDLLPPGEIVDLIDMDLQGFESVIVPHAIARMTETVKRVHIGTHDHDGEAILRRVFSEHGWINVNDYPCQQRNATPFGAIDFTDGVQSWVNPRFSVTIG